MKIKIALIPSEHTSKAQDLSSKLQNKDSNTLYVFL